MTKQSVYCAIFFSMLTTCGVVLAQSDQDSDRQNSQEPCARYSMQVVTPSTEADYNLKS